MKNLLSYDRFILLEKSRTVEFFRQHPEMLSSYSKGIDAHSKAEWDPKRVGAIDRSVEDERKTKVFSQLKKKIERFDGSSDMIDPNDKKSWSIAEILSGVKDGFSNWWDWDYMKKSIMAAKDVDDFAKNNTAKIRSWKFPHENYNTSRDISQYGKFFKFMRTHYSDIQKLMKWTDTALTGIKGSAQAGFEKDIMKLGLSMKDLEVAMSYVENWTSMSRKKLDPAVWPLLQKISVDPSALPKVIYRGIFVDGAKIKDEAKFLKLWSPGSKPGASQGKATSWSVDRGTAAEFMTDQDFIKDRDKGYYVLLRWTVDPSKVIADLRNLPVDHKFWNQQELIVDPAARDYEVDTIIPGSGGYEAHREFTNTIKGGQGAFGKSKTEFAMDFLSTPYETLSPNQRMEFKRIVKMTVAEFNTEYPGSRINPEWNSVAMPIWNYLSKYTSNIERIKVERNRVEFRYFYKIGAIEYLNDPLIKSTYTKISKETGFNQFAGKQAIVSNIGIIELLDDDYYDQDLKVQMPTKCDTEVVETGDSRDIDIKSDKALNDILNEIGESHMLEAMKKRQSEQKLPKNINIQIQ